jgi:hypothetical protein
LDWKAVGVHAFWIKRTWRHPRGVLKPIASELLHVSTPSGITWLKGKGAVGLCWDEQRDIGVNLAEDWGPLLGCTESEWDQAPEAVKYGLTYAEFKRAGEYGAIVVTPIFDSQSHEVRGCVSVDAPEDSYDVLWSSSVREAIQDAAQTIWRSLTPLSAE